MATNKFKFSFKITGLELEIEGTKEDVAAITSTIGNQLKSLTQTTGLENQKDNETVNGDAEIIESSLLTNTNGKKKNSQRKSRKSGNSEKTNNTESGTIDTKFDSAKFGAPSMSWTTLQKALWTLYVVKEEADVKEMSGYQITETFNKHFRQAKPVSRPNVYRDLGKAKIANPSLVGEDKAKNPAKWYLTEAGIKFIQELITKQRHGVNTEEGVDR